jgi:hypothetical protein
VTEMNNTPIDPSTIDINDAMKMMLFNGDFITALRTIQKVDDTDLQGYLRSPLGTVETNTLMRDLTVFEAMFNNDFLRGLIVGTAAAVTDCVKHENKGNGVMATVRAGLAMLRSKNIDIVTGREIIF